MAREYELGHKLHKRKTLRVMRPNPDILHTRVSRKMCG
jgi:hypothetical protein